eukprot:TRINITY_DN435_c0_g1_i10.p1 TRINITY_DN435_c0_g1~~TRINITY_DN435_c0_g1_i10.p1  ORF type:complete len:239 (-),score=22.95 TRINITY_DN435_c0_g1_i10:464-1180(-)
MENVFEEIRIHNYITRNCDTPFIIGLHDFFLDLETIVCVQEFASEGDMFEYCMHRMTKDAKQREILAKDLFKQLIEGVSTLHSHFIVHQDLSLENLLLHRTQKKQLFIKIIDFGMSRGGPGSQFSKDNWRVEIPSVIGKKQYRSPEVWTLKYDAKANDIHCMGCCLFSMLTLRAPFRNSSPDLNQEAKDIQNGQLSYVLKCRGISHLSPHAVDLLQKMLLPEDQRITMNGIRSHPWLA